MSEQKYTPGPWEVSGATHVWSPTAHANVASVSEPRGEGSDVGYQPLKRNSPDLEEACANADLISAAPDLLEAARHVLLLLDHPERSVTALDADKLRAAIAKAVGEQPCPK